MMPKITMVTIVCGRWIWFHRGPHIMRQHYLARDGRNLKRLFRVLCSRGDESEWRCYGDQMVWTRKGGAK